MSNEMMLRRFSSAALVALLLSGCASSGPTGSEILTGSIQPQRARMVIYRTAIMGLAVQPSYIVDGKPVAPAQPNGFLVCDMLPGKHTVAVDNTSLNVSLGSSTDRQEIALAPGETRFVRADMNPGLTMGFVSLTQVTAEQGKSDTASLYKQPEQCG